MRYFKLVVFIGLISCLYIQCKKQASTGGNATIKGKLYAIDFNSSGFSPAIDSFYVPAENVYIIYGDEINVSNNIRTNSKGEFEFNFLRKGKYTIFALSRDTSIHFSGSNKDITHDTTVMITDKNQVLDLQTFIVLR